VVPNFSQQNFNWEEKERFDRFHPQKICQEEKRLGDLCSKANKGIVMLKAGLILWGKNPEKK